MGSSNRACSISNLSLGGGTPVAFFILHPAKQYGNGDDLIIHPTSHFFYTNCFFNPLCLPIFGRYDDYGGVEDIEENSNTKAIEQFFELPIVDIITCIIGGESAANMYSAAYRPEGEHQELFGWKNDGTHEFNAAWLKKLGFVKSPHPKLPDKELFQFGDYPFWIEPTTYKLKIPDVEPRDEPAFNIWTRSGIKTKEGNRCGLKDEFAEAFREITNYLIQVPAKYQEKAKLLSKLSGMFVHREIYNALVNSPAERFGKDPAVADNRVTEELLQEYGFRRIPEEEQISIDPHHATLYRKESFPFDIKWGPYGMAIVHQRHKEYYVFGGIKQLYLDKIREKWELMTGTPPEDTFPEPKNIKQATDLERMAVVKKFNELTGATLTWAEGDDANHHIYSLKRFVKVWRQFTGEALDISHHCSKMQHELEFEKLQNDLIKFSQRKPEVFTCKRGSIEEQCQAHEAEENYRRALTALDRKPFEPRPFEPKPEGEEYQKISDISLWDPFGHWKFASDDGFLMYYKDWKYFPDIYRQAIMEGSDNLKQAFVDYSLFAGSMYSCNRFFFPAMNGEQCGNLEESRNLLLASLRIVDQELASQEECTIDSIEWDAKYFGE